MSFSWLRLLYSSWITISVTSLNCSSPSSSSTLKIPPATTWIPFGLEPVQQCAAVPTQFSFRTHPPQNKLLSEAEDRSWTCHGNSPSAASSPPTIVKGFDGAIEMKLLISLRNFLQKKYLWIFLWSFKFENTTCMCYSAKSKYENKRLHDVKEKKKTAT